MAGFTVSQITSDENLRNLGMSFIHSIFIIRHDDDASVMMIKKGKRIRGKEYEEEEVVEVLEP